MGKVVGAILLVALVGCGDVDTSGRQATAGVGEPAREELTDVPGGTCDLNWRRPTSQDSTVLEIDRGSSAPCEVAFREVVRLRGSLSGLAPRLPVLELRTGRFVTATYTEGKLAVWDADGSLVTSFGMGAGEGPGEFAFPAGLAELEDGSVAVLTGRRYIHIYAASGDYRTSYSGNSLVGVGQVSLVGGELATVRPTGELVRISMEGVKSVRDVLPPTSAMRFVSGDQEGLWVSDHNAYDLTRVRLDGSIGPTLRSRAFGFGDRDPGPNSPNVFGVTVGLNNLIWVQFNTADPNAPSVDRPREGLTREEALEVTSQYRDSRLDVLSPDGTLVATAVFDDVSEMPFPVSSRRWVLLEDDLLQSVVILEAVLVPR